MWTFWCFLLSNAPGVAGSVRSELTSMDRLWLDCINRGRCFIQTQMIFSVPKFSEILKLDSSRPRHLTSLRLYYIQGLRFGQSIEPCGVTSCSPPCSLVRCCVFLMGPMASATVMDFGISTSRNILLDIIWLYTYIYIILYISYTYKETATLDISDFWYKYTISICICIFIYIYTIIYTVLLCNLYYMLSDTSQRMFFFPTKLVGSKECSQTGNQVKQPYTMAIHGCLSLISAQALGCWCWNAKAVAEVGELVMLKLWNSYVQNGWN